jgi:2-haloalkanoic acid dehalogenase type II
MKLTDFRVLTFDCYGTLIDWESGIHTALQPLLVRTGRQISREALLELFGRHESAQEAETPGMIYSQLLGVVHQRLAVELGVASTVEENRAFGASVPAWPVFADTVSALQYLQKYYKLVILSNVDRESFKGSNAKLGVTFDAIYTAQDVGSYKPDPANFRYLLEHLAARGHQPGEILHTAQSLFHDHAPAQAIGLATAWIDRRQDLPGGGATPPPPAGAVYDFRFASLAAMMTAHQDEIRR